MSHKHRRQFLADVGQGMLVASVGASFAVELGLAPAMGAESEKRLTFGRLEPLVGLMQDTPPEKLQPMLVEKIKSGSSLKSLVAAGALANARSFGGQDYVGFHTMMALMPAYQMAGQMPKGTEALPVLKVLFRNAERIQQHGGRRTEVLKPVDKVTATSERGGEQLRAAMRTGNLTEAERTFHRLSQGAPADAFNSLQYIVQEYTDVHRVVLAWRAWDVLQLTGKEHAHTLLRQSVRYCTEREAGLRDRVALIKIRQVLPKMLDQYKLVGRDAGTRKGDDQWLSELTRAIFGGSPEQAAESVAAALSEGFVPAEIGEAISLAANQIVLHDAGRKKAAERKAHSARPRGSVHGDSIGVHASDAANAWRNIAGVSNQRNTVASLIVGAYHTAEQAGRVSREPYSLADEQEKLRGKDGAELLGHTERAIRGKDQAGAAAAIALYGESGHSPQPVFDLLLKYAVSEDGALHAEKYYTTVAQDYANTRVKYRWNHLIALARVTASEYGWQAPGHQAAMRLLTS